MTAAVPEPLVRFIDVRKSYDGKVDAVRALNLEVAESEFLTLLGPSTRRANFFHETVVPLG